jgi:agmatine/peptidylarginine deiminase
MIRFPAEWEKQTAVLIAWPHATGDFSNRLESVEDTYAIIADTITEYQRLFIVCRDEDHQRHIQKIVQRHEDIDFIHAPVNDIWVRDTTFLTVEKDHTLHYLNFQFNGWGEKYDFAHDNALNHKLANTKYFKGKSHHDIDFILEGGSIESDGEGTILTTSHCLLNPNRNSSLNKEQIEEQLKNHLGAKRILWVNQENLSGDDTDAHIDTLARFCTPNTIAYTSCDDINNPHYESLHRMKLQLEVFRTFDDKPYNLVALPLPTPIFDEDDEPLPANYSNFLIINHAVMVPVYGDKNDAVALARLAAVFPEHKILPIPCRPLVHQYGSLHCMTMQFPEQARG